MPEGKPRSEKERAERHESVYGSGSKPPEDRLGLGAYRFSTTYVLLAFLAGVALGYLLAQ